jgi:O-antigen polymerase
VLIYTQSRTACIASFLGVFFVITQYFKVFERFKEIVKSKLLRITFLLLIFGSILLVSKQLYEFKQNSANGRVLVWKVSLEMVKESPVFGKGFNGFGQTYDNYQVNYFSKLRDLQEVLVAGKVQYAFNDYLQIIVEYGFMGFLLLMGMISGVFHDHKNIYQGLLITCLIAGLSSYPLQGLPTSLNFYFVLMLSSLGSEKLNFFTLKTIQTKLVWASLICVSSYFFMANFKKDKVERECFVAEHFFNTDQYPEAIRRYEKLYPDIEKDAPNLMIYAKALALDGQHQKAIKIYEQALKYLADPFFCNNSGLSYQSIGDFKKAEIMYQKSSRMIPNLIYPRYLLAKLYIQNKELDKAIIIAREIVNLPVKVYSEAGNEMRMEMTDFLVSNQTHHANNTNH